MQNDNVASEPWPRHLRSADAQNQALLMDHLTDWFYPLLGWGGTGTDLFA